MWGGRGEVARVKTAGTWVGGGGFRVLPLRKGLYPETPPYITTPRAEGVPLVSCHRMLEPGSSCHFFSSILFFLAKVIFKSQKQFLILGKFYFWSSCYFLELLLGSSIWWRELGETPSGPAAR